MPTAARGIKAYQKLGPNLLTHLHMHMHSRLCDLWILCWNCLVQSVLSLVVGLSPGDALGMEQALNALHALLDGADIVLEGLHPLPPRQAVALRVHSTQTWAM